jgi:hypothetical protein
LKFSLNIFLYVGTSSILWPKFLRTGNTSFPSYERRSSTFHPRTSKWFWPTWSLAPFPDWRTSWSVANVILETCYINDTSWSGNCRTWWPCLFVHQVWQDVQYSSWVRGSCSSFSFREETLCLWVVQ